MANYITIKETDKGLEIKATKEGKEYLKEHEDRDYIMQWCDLIEDYECNGSFKFVLPEKLGWLTDAPIIALNVEYDEESNIEENEDSKYWYFDDYMIRNELKELRAGKKVIFTQA